jgi:hypothetical protein
MIEQSSREKDDGDWLALLGGYTVNDADPGTRREAQELREMLLRRQEQETGGDERPALERLLFRLRSERLLGTNKNPWWRQPAWLPALAASLVAVVLVLPVWQPWRGPEAPGPDEVPIFKAFSMPRALYTAEPERKARTLAERLRALGAQVKRLEAPGRLLFDVLLPPEPEAELTAYLRSEGLAVPADGRLRIEVLPKR